MYNLWSLVETEEYMGKCKLDLLLLKSAFLNLGLERCLDILSADEN